MWDLNIQFSCDCRKVCTEPTHCQLSSITSERTGTESKSTNSHPLRWQPLLDFRSFINKISKLWAIAAHSHVQRRFSTRNRRQNETNHNLVCIKIWIWTTSLHKAVCTRHRSMLNLKSVFLRTSNTTSRTPRKPLHAQSQLRISANSFEILFDNFDFSSTNSNGSFWVKSLKHKTQSRTKLTPLLEI